MSNKIVKTLQLDLYTVYVLKNFFFENKYREYCTECVTKWDDNFQVKLDQF